VTGGVDTQSNTLSFRFDQNGTVEDWGRGQTKSSAGMFK